MRRSWMPFVALVTLAIAPVAFVRCGPSAATCDATRCADGCCDAEGVCQPGTQSNACGTGGETCSDCLSAGTICTQSTQTCGTGAPANDAGTVTPDAGTDAGTADAGMTDAGTMDAGTMDAGTVDAGMVTCREITTFTRVSGEGGYEVTGDAAPYDAYAWANVYTAGEDGGVPAGDGGVTVDFAWLEIWRSQDEQFPPTPVQRTFSPQVTYATCDVCLGYSEECDPVSFGCVRHYYAVGGNATVTEYSLDATMGTVKASASQVRYEEWDFNGDAPVSGGRCIEVTSITIDETW